MAIKEKPLFVLMGLKELESYCYCVKCMFKFTPEILEDYDCRGQARWEQLSVKCSSEFCMEVMGFTSIRLKYSYYVGSTLPFALCPGSSTQ